MSVLIKSYEFNVDSQFQSTFREFLIFVLYFRFRDDESLNDSTLAGISTREWKV